MMKSALPPLLFLLLACCAGGCGSAYNAMLEAASLQPDPDRLMTCDFYQSATVDTLRREIGGRSLAGMSYTQRSVSRPHGGFLASLQDMVNIVVPNSSMNFHTITPLSVALNCNADAQIIKVLLEAGCLVDDKILDNALPYGDHDILALLLARARPENSCATLSRLIRKGDTELLRIFLDNAPAVDVNCLEPYGNALRPVTLAVLVAGKDMARLLVSRGADPNLKNADGATPLTVAARQENAEAVKLLLDLGARPEAGL